MALRTDGSLHSDREMTLTTASEASRSKATPNQAVLVSWTFPPTYTPDACARIPPEIRSMHEQTDSETEMPEPLSPPWLHRQHAVRYECSTCTGITSNDCGICSDCDNYRGCTCHHRHACVSCTPHTRCSYYHQYLCTACQPGSACPEYQQLLTNGRPRSRAFTRP